MPVTLDRPISWKNASGDDARMLDQLQPNILKGHTRDIFTAIFVKFHDRGQAASLLAELSTDGIVPALMKSANTHLNEIQAFKQMKTPGTSYVGVGLTVNGYDKLEIPKQLQPDDAAFQRGMTNNQTRALLDDPDVDTWDGHFGQLIDAVILVGDATAVSHSIALERVRQMIAARPLVLLMEEQSGKGQHNGAHEGIEHFGYVDGRSQPLFFEEDIADEPSVATWDPGFGPGRAIVPDPAAPDPTTQFGSYFVFRKLEQNVQLFKKEEGNLATQLELAPTDRGRAGAMIVGRFEDGRPLTMAPIGSSPVVNDFNYSADPDGGRCPLFGHIRKMNPRGSGGFESHESERLHIMARRGQTYGERTDDINDDDLNGKPTAGVGLLFMAFNADLVDQFEFVQRNWANNENFPRHNSPNAPGLDQVIGHGTRTKSDCPLTWDAKLATAGAFGVANPIAQAVTMKGGDYFFMPSLAFLRDPVGFEAA